MITVTKRFEFCYGHYLPEYDGACKNMHGHNSVVEVEVGTGIMLQSESPYSGMIMDFGIIKDVCKPIIDSLDHCLINEHPGFVHFCEKILGAPPFNINKTVPTAELICLYLVSEIKKQIPTISRLRVTETPDSWAEWKAGIGGIFDERTIN